MSGEAEQAPRPQRGDELELSIDSLAFGGEGVARLGDSGYVVFVAGAIPGDRVRAVVHKRKRSYAHARTVEILEPSPERIAPVADHPGVPWQVLPYERQLQIKSGQVDEALRRIGHLDGFELQEIVPAVRAVALPQQARVLLRRRRGGRGARVRLPRPGGRQERDADRGLHARLRGRQPGARASRCAWCREQGLSSWDRGRGGGPRGEREGQSGPAPDGRVRLRNLVVREGRRTGKLQVRIVTSHGELEAGELAAALSQALGDTLSGVLWTRTPQPRRDDRRRRDRAGLGRRRAARAPR